MTLSKLPSRPAYTLIELMVVVGLIVLLATLTVAVANSSLVESYKVVGAVDRLSGWLLTAKQRALRDKTPVGVRLIRDTENPNYCRQAQLVEMPTIYAPNQDSNLNNLPLGAPFVAIRYVTTNVPNGQPAPQNPTDTALVQESVVWNAGTNSWQPGPVEVGVYLYWPNNVAPYPQFRPQTPTDPLGGDLLAGDSIEIGELKTRHRISAINEVAAPAWFPPMPAGRYYKLTLAISNVTLNAAQSYPPSPPYPTNLMPINAAVPLATPTAPGSTQQYPTGYPAVGGANFFMSYYFGLYRSSRPILGEPLLQLPANMAVDLTPVIDNAPVGPSANDLLLSQNAPLSLEVMFNPNGTVQSGDAGVIHFWLRDTRNAATGANPLTIVSTSPNATMPTVNDVYVDRSLLMNSGEHALVSIFTKTGAIATYPIFPPDQAGRYDGRSINIPGGDGGLSGPYKYALKATNTGL